MCHNCVLVLNVGLKYWKTETEKLFHTLACFWFSSLWKYISIFKELYLSICVSLLNCCTLLYVFGYLILIFKVLHYHVDFFYYVIYYVFLFFLINILAHSADLFASGESFGLQARLLCLFGLLLECLVISGHLLISIVTLVNQIYYQLKTRRVRPCW